MTHTAAGAPVAATEAELFDSPAGRAPVALVPGLAVAAYLRPVARSFAAAGHRTSLLRPPGWPGRTDGSSRRQAPTRPEALGAAVARWLADQSEPVVLVGQSVGGQVAAHAAAHAPGAVRLLVLQGPTVDPARRTLPRLVGRWLVDAPREPLSLGRSQLPEWREVGALHLARLLRATLDDDLALTLTRVRAPVLVVVGARDGLSRKEWAAGLGTFPLRVQGGGHTALYDDPAGFVAVVDDALERRR